ncbi:DUF3515 family protein [Aeromicrobium sp.]|uniref:DUF3515 family protein n=1 Tax=Aeromicrobium sp. TaxID=1871063 RepID=UPI003D6B1F00
MPRRQLLSALVLVAALAGCGGQLDVDDYPTAEGTDLDCKALLADVPQRVAGQENRDVSGRVAAAWGDPAIILRCGVEKPEALRPESQCFAVRDVGWLAETTADGYLFTTIGRTFHVSVEVPKSYDPAADVLADLASSVKKHNPEKEPCV